MFFNPSILDSDGRNCWENSGNGGRGAPWDGGEDDVGDGGADDDADDGADGADDGGGAYGK